MHSVHDQPKESVDTKTFNYGRALGAPKGNERYSNAASLADKLRATSCAIAMISWRLDMALRQVQIATMPSEQTDALTALVTAQADLMAELQTVPGIGLFRYGAVGEWFKTRGLNWGKRIGNH